MTSKPYSDGLSLVLIREKKKQQYSEEIIHPSAGEAAKSHDIAALDLLLAFMYVNQLLHHFWFTSCGYFSTLVSSLRYRTKVPRALDGVRSASWWKAGRIEKPDLADATDHRSTSTSYDLLQWRIHDISP
jgi:hypothetical protein